MRLFLSSQFSHVGEKFTKLKWGGSTVAFVTTAGDPYESKPWMDADRETLKTLGYTVEDYDIKNKNEEEIYNDLRKKDIIFVAGGNTFYLLYYIQQSGFHTAVSKLLKEKIYVGSSAGSIVAGPSIEPTGSLDKKEKAPPLTSYKGMGFADFVILPHADSPKYGPLGRTIKEEWADRFNFIVITNDQAVVVEDTGHRVV